MKYFAYGANLSKANMARLCPGAKPLNSVVLPNYKLLFTLSSRTEGGGTATIKLVHGEHVPGALYEIDAACLRALDKYEGRPIVRGGKCAIIEGNGVQRNVVLEFPSYEHALGYAQSPEYAEAKALRQGAGSIDITVVEGV